MSEHIEPSHLDAPVRNLTGLSTAKRTADFYHEIEQNIDRKDENSEKNEEKKESQNKDQKSKEDRYEKEFIDNAKKDEVKINNENKNSDPNGPGVVIDFTV